MQPFELVLKLLPGAKNTPVVFGPAFFVNGRGYHTKASHKKRKNKSFVAWNKIEQNANLII